MLLSFDIFPLLVIAIFASIEYYSEEPRTITLSISNVQMNALAGVLEATASYIVSTTLGLPEKPLHAWYQQQCVFGGRGGPNMSPGHAARELATVFSVASVFSNSNQNTPQRN